jgi:hypothetical protein
MVAIAPRSAMVTPLTKIRKSDGRVYERPVEIECALEHLDLLPRTEILGRLAIRDRTSPDYLPSECLVYLIRNTRTDNNAAYFDVLYGELLRRIVRALPKVEERAADGRDGVSVSREQIRDEVRGRFENWLVEDRANLSDALDIFECRFDFAVARTRERAWRRLGSETTRRHPKTVEALTDSLEAGGKEFAGLHSRLSSDPTSRMRLHAMIDNLPDTHRRIIQMLIADFPIDSKKEGEVSIRSVLDCDEKTVRNRRDAFVRDMRALVSSERAS